MKKKEECVKEKEKDILSNFNMVNLKNLKGKDMKIKQFRYAADNLGYLLYNRNAAMAVDGGAVDAMVSFIRKNGLELTYVTNTHSHPDHTSGNQALLDRSNAEFLNHRRLIDIGHVTLEGEKIAVYHTPGHTEDSIIFYFKGVLVTGDTLFNGKAGRCFSGNTRGFLESIKLIMGFPEDTVIYAGHDYVEEYMATARGLEPNNPHIDGYLAQYDPNHVCSLLKDEMHVNPSLRFNDERMISVLKTRGFKIESAYDRWMSIMNLV